MSRWRIGKRMKIARVDNNTCTWKEGDTGVVVEHNIRDGKSVFDVKLKMDRTRDGRRYAIGDDDNLVPANKPPLWERIKLKIRRPKVDTTPGFEWNKLGWHPNDFTEEKEEGTEQNGISS